MTEQEWSVDLSAITKRDFLKEDSQDMSIIRVHIIEDRNYDIPDWFYAYITDTDICSMIMNFNTSEHTIDNQCFEEMLIRLDQMGIIRNYKSIAVTIFETNKYNFVHCFNSHKLGKKLIHLVRDPNHAAKCIRSFITNNKMVPYIYVRMYILAKLNKPIWTASKQDVCVAINSLLGKYNGYELDLIYPVVYVSRMVPMTCTDMSYHKYLSVGGTWYNADESPIHVIDYMDIYWKANRDSFASKPMHPDILTGIFDLYPTKESFINSQDATTIRTSVIFSVLRHIDNVKFIFFDLTYEERGMIEKFAMESWQSPTNEFKKLVDVLSINGRYDKLQQLVFKYVGYGINVEQIILYLPDVINPNNISEFLSIINPSQLQDLCLRNPVITESTQITFIDMMMDKLQEVVSSVLDKIRGVMSSCLSLYSTLYSSEKYALYGKNKEFYGMCALYPGIMVDNKSLSFVDVTEIYNKNQNVLPYINPSLIKDATLFNHVKTHGYVKLMDVGSIGFESLLSIKQYAQLLKSGEGYGYLLDFNNIGYRNMYIRYILDI